MLVHPVEILEQFPVRKTGAQKQAFRAAVQAYGEKLGYPVTEEKGAFGVCNLILGDPGNARYLVTAHYDTCAKSLLPNLITPCSLHVFLLIRLFRLVVFCLCAVVLAAVTALLIAASSILAGTVLGDGWIIFVGLMTPGLTCFYVMLFLFWRFIGQTNQCNLNDNASGVVTLLEIAGTLPENQRHKVCFVLFDMEEAGLFGSAFYRKKHRSATDRQLVLNLDCVGDGDHIRMFPTKKLRKDRVKCTSLYKACGYFGKKDVLVHETGFYTYPSDQRHFPYGVGICALNRRKKLLYLSRIHTSKDTVLDITNVNILRAALTTFICRDEVN